MKQRRPIVGATIITTALPGTIFSIIYWKDHPEIAMQHFGFVLLAGSAWLAIKQFRDHHELERRKMALTEGKRIKEAYSGDTQILNEKFKILTRKNTTISVNEIHQAICEIDHKTKKLKSSNDSETTYLLAKDGPKYNTRRAIINVLNAYEYLATGVLHQVFDRDLIKDLYGYVLIKGYNNFKDYIRHYNGLFSPDKKDIWENFVTLATEFEKETDTKAKKPKREGTGN